MYASRSNSSADALMATTEDAARCLRAQAAGSPLAAAANREPPAIATTSVIAARPMSSSAGTLTNAAELFWASAGGGRALSVP